MEFLYLAGLLFSISGLVVLDRRFKLGFFNNAKQTWLTLGCAIGIFIIWDILGIMLGIFQHGITPFNLPFTIAPEFPIEELAFLFLLCYSTLILYKGITLWRSRI